MTLVEPLHVGGLKIEAIEYRSLSEEQIGLLNVFANGIREEAAPEDPTKPLHHTEAEVRTLPDQFIVHQFWALDEDGRLAAQAYTWWTETDNLHVANIGIEVLAPYRRRGVGKALLGLLVDVTEAAGRRLIIGTSTSRVPDGEVFARRMDAQVGLATHINRLLLAEVDRELVRRWIDDGPLRAPGYELVRIDGPYPADHIAAIVRVMTVMNTAPIDDLDLEDRVITQETVRAWERSQNAAGTERWALFARHIESADLVGYTAVFWNPAEPKTVWQGDTAVDPAHRGHALGKWLKAAMLQRIFDGRPGVEDIRTGNADSNAPMLGINHALGFKPYIAHMGWQVSVEKARAYLDGSSA